MRAEELLGTLTDDELKKRANLCFFEAENTSIYKQAGPEEKLRLLTEADFYLKALIWRHDDRIADRDFRLEKWVIALISVEIVLSLIFGFLGLWEGWNQGKALKREVDVLGHMETSTRATSESLQKLVAAQDASLQILQQEQAERTKKPRLALYVGNIPLDRAPVRLKAPRPQSTQATASLDLLLKNDGDAPVSTFRLHALVPAGIVFQTDRLFTVPESQPPPDLKTYGVTLQLAPLPAGQVVRIHADIFVPDGYPPFEIPFTVDALELRAVALVGSLTVLPPRL